MDWLQTYNTGTDVPMRSLRSMYSSIPLAQSLHDYAYTREQAVKLAIYVVIILVIYNA